MNWESLFAKWQASDDQRLQVFKRFYGNLEPNEKKRLYEYVKGINALMPGRRDSQLLAMREMGCDTDRVIGVQFYCEFPADGAEANINPQLLQGAIEAWDRGEEFAPPSDHRPPGGSK